METITDGPMVKNLPCNAENISVIPGPETKIPQATEQLSLCAVTTKPTHSSAHAHKQSPDRRHLLSPCAPRESVCCNERSCMMQ